MQRLHTVASDRVNCGDYSLFSGMTPDDNCIKHVGGMLDAYADTIDELEAERDRYARQLADNGGSGAVPWELIGAVAVAAGGVAVYLDNPTSPIAIPPAKGLALAIQALFAHFGEQEAQQKEGSLDT